MPKRKRYGTRRYRRRRKLRFKRHARKGKLKFRVRGGERPVNMLTKQPTMANRIVLRTAVFSDWQTIAFAGGGLQQWFAFNMLTCHQPLVSLPTAPVQTYQGLSDYLSPGDQTITHYSVTRILHSKIRIEINRCTTPVNSLKLVLLADPVVGGGSIKGAILNMLALESQPYCKSKMVMNNCVKSEVLSLSCSPRKLAGVSKAQFTQPGFYAASAVDPAISLWWVASFQPANGNAEATGTWTWRVRMDALVELTHQWSIPLSVN